MKPPARRDETPWRSLLPRLGLVFGLTNLCLFPLFLGLVTVALAGMFGTKPSWAKFWEPVLLVLVVAVAAMVPAQAALASICLAWSDGSFWGRLRTYWLVVGGGLGCFLGGIPVFFLGAAAIAWLGGESDDFPKSHVNTESFWRDIRQLFAYTTQLPMILLGVQLPFWGLRLCTHCRLEQKSSADCEINNASRPDSLSIQDLLFGTALVAVALALLQVGDRTITVMERQQEKAFLFTVIFAAAIALGISLFVALPVALLFLSRLSLATAWGVTLAAAGVISVIWFSIASSLGPVSQPGALFGILCLLTYVSLGSYATGLTLLRRAGWQLVFGKLG